MEWSPGRAAPTTAACLLWLSKGMGRLSLVRAGALWDRDAMDGFPYACIPHLLVRKASGLATEDVCHLKGTFPYDILPSGFFESEGVAWVDGLLRERRKEVSIFVQLNAFLPL